MHRPVKPEDIVLAGDSAGGGLTIALLQVIRDAGLPLPAGAILISPWCDLTHSFPSIYQNTTTDVVPPTGLSLHKPSSLWPPPPDGVNSRVREGLRSSVRAAFHRRRPSGPAMPQQQEAPPQSSASMVELPPASASNQTVVLEREGEKIEIHSQLQLYCPNGLVRHPLVSAALSYLGGLCPLLVITSDREVLRDEGIYSAHRAANPAKYPIKDEILAVYPRFRDLTPENMVPTPVHLQVYDGKSLFIFLPHNCELIRTSRRRPCPTCSLPVHDSRQVLLPRDGHLLQTSLPDRCKAACRWPAASHQDPGRTCCINSAKRASEAPEPAPDALDTFIRDDANRYFLRQA